MRDYVITVNSTVDVPKEWLEERNVPVVPLKYTIDGETYTDMEGLSAKEFFAKLREGKMSTTSQVNPEEAAALLEPYVKEGKDILHLGFSSGLSGTLNSMKIAGEMLNELAQWVEDNKLHVCHDVTVDDLNHLHRGGRVSKTTAVLGTLVQIKPIIHMDNDGKLQVIGKERGRKKSLNKIVDMAAEQSKGWDNDIVMITHGDCIEDAEYVAKPVREKMGIDNILINNIGTVIGSHTGPGTVALFFWGKKREA